MQDSKHPIFNGEAAMKRKEAINILISNLRKERSDLKSYKITFIIEEDFTMSLLLEKKIVSASASATSSDEELFRLAHPFPTREKVAHDLSNAIPHRADLTPSFTYDIACTKEDGLKLFKSYGFKACLSKDQPKDSRLLRFRVFKEDKAGFVKHAMASKPARDSSASKPARYSKSDASASESDPCAFPSRKAGKAIKKTPEQIFALLRDLGVHVDDSDDESEGESEQVSKPAPAAKDPRGPKGPGPQGGKGRKGGK
jgi:hypothetical protein